MHYLLPAAANCQGRQQWLLKSNSSNTWFDTIFLVSEIRNECHTCLYYLGTWLWSEACHVLMISFRNCEIWQSVKIAPFKLLTSGNCHNFTFLNSLFVVFLVPWNLKKVVCLQEQIMIIFWRSQTKSGICDIRWFSRPLSNSYMNFATLGVTLVNPKPRPYMVRIYYVRCTRVSAGIHFAGWVSRIPSDQSRLNLLYSWRRFAA